MVKGFPVVLSDRGAPFVAVEKNAPLATVAENGRGLPIRLVEKGAPPIILQGGVAWTPLLLFLDGEDGAWYDPSDLSTVFQNAAGTTPGAAGSPLGLELDKRLGGELGPELVTNGDFSNGITGWEGINGATVTLVDGRARVAIADQSSSGLSSSANVSVTSGRLYEVTASVEPDGFTGTSVVVTLLGISSGAITISSTGVTKVRAFIRATSTSIGTNVRILRGASGQSGGLFVDDVSVRELPGLHASQATTSARPTLVRMPKTGRRNLLTYSEDFSSAAWSFARASFSGLVVTATETNASGTWFGQNITMPGGDGTLSVRVLKSSGFVMLTAGDASLNANNVRVWFDTTAGTVGTAQDNGSGWTVVSSAIVDDGLYWKCSVAYNTATTNQFQRFYIVDGDGNLAVTISRSVSFAGGAQLEVGSTATPYQRVNSAFDVHEDGVPDVWYWQGDGTDDKLTLTLASAFTGYIFIAGTNGSILEPVSFSAGAVALGPLTYTGGTPGIFNAIGGIVGVVLLDRALTEDEQTELIAYYKGKGAKGLLELGPELVTNGTFDTGIEGWTASAISGSNPAILSWIEGGGMQINSGEGSRPCAYQSIDTVAGGVYLGLVERFSGVNPIQLRAGLSPNGSEYGYVNTQSGAGTSHLASYIFTATSSASFVNVSTFGAGSNSNVRTVSVRELRAEEDWA